MGLTRFAQIEIHVTEYGFGESGGSRCSEAPVEEPKHVYRGKAMLGPSKVVYR